MDKEGNLNFVIFIVVPYFTVKIQLSIAFHIGYWKPPINPQAIEIKEPPIKSLVEKCVHFKNFPKRMPRMQMIKTVRFSVSLSIWVFHFIETIVFHWGLFLFLAFAHLILIFTFFHLLRIKNADKYHAHVYLSWLNRRRRVDLAQASSLSSIEFVKDSLQLQGTSFINFYGFTRIRA